MTSVPLHLLAMLAIAVGVGLVVAICHMLGLSLPW
jgi:hypothetical protein